MAIRQPRRTIGQMAEGSGYSQALAHDKYQDEKTEQAETFLEGLIKRARSEANKTAGLSQFERLATSFIPGVGTAASLYDAYAKHKAGKDFDFSFNVPDWAIGTPFEDYLKAQGAGIEAETEQSYKKKMGIQALIAGIPAIGKGVGELTSTLGMAAKDLPFGLELAKAADKPIFTGGDAGGLFGLGKNINLGKFSPKYSEVASLFAEDKNLIDFLTGGETEPIVPTTRPEKRQWRNPYQRRV